MQPIHPRQLLVMRIRFGLAGLAALAAIVAGDAGLSDDGLIAFGWVSGGGLLLVLAGVFLLPRRRYKSWGYRVEEDELFVRHGLMVRQVTVVPFGRVQHIDVAQGPIERACGVATLVLNTAGTRGSAVKLPGLLHAAADELRDRIRGKIRQDLM